MLAQVDSLFWQFRHFYIDLRLGLVSGWRYRVHVPCDLGPVLRTSRHSHGGTVAHPNADVFLCLVIVQHVPLFNGHTLRPSTCDTFRETRVLSSYFLLIFIYFSAAVTIHKAQLQLSAQRMTLDRVTIDLGRKRCAFGLIFIALSRAKLFDSLRVHPFYPDRYNGIEKGKHVEARCEDFRHLKVHAASLSSSLPILTLSMLSIVSHCIHNM